MEHIVEIIALKHSYYKDFLSEEELKTIIQHFIIEQRLGKLKLKNVKDGFARDIARAVKKHIKYPEVAESFKIRKLRPPKKPRQLLTEAEKQERIKQSKRA